ncbi:MAG: hypothetical protein WKF51_11590 [Geodermatophilaceae bacterium]
MSNQPSTVHAPDEWSDHYRTTFAGVSELHAGYCEGCTMSIWRCDELRLDGDPEGCCAGCGHYTQKVAS